MSFVCFYMEYVAQKEREIDKIRTYFILFLDTVLTSKTRFMNGNDDFPTVATHHSLLKR